MKHVILLIIQTCMVCVVGSSLWGWFIVPSFKVEPISYAMALGILLSGKFFTGGFEITEHDETQTEAVIMLTLIIWGLGWLTNYLMLTYNL